MRVCVCVLQGHGEADRRLSPGVGGRGRSPLINFSRHKPSPEG